ncbi:MAG: T9SS type A sorting domain-containing protein [Saprospiraceae bacterium]|nr:T9SS type A sorting domain-containing protein [Saprospiraceae bacterium]
MVRVYPNPTAGQAQVVLSGALDVPLAFRLFNAAGIHVLHQTLEPGRAEYPLHLEHLPAGIYFWTATSGSKFSTRGKLVLVR